MAFRNVSWNGNAPRSLVEQFSAIVPPSGYTNPILWSRADVYTSGGGTTTWPSQAGSAGVSGNTSNATASAPTLVASDPDYGGKPSIGSNGSLWLDGGALTGGPYALSLGAPLTYLFVLKPTASQGFGYVLSNGPSGTPNIRFRDFPDRIEQVIAAAISAAVTPGTPYAIAIIEQVDDGTNSFPTQIWLYPKGGAPSLITTVFQTNGYALTRISDFTFGPGLFDGGQYTCPERGIFAANLDTTGDLTKFWAYVADEYLF